VRGTRVLLDVIIVAFQEGATPKNIVQKFPSVALPTYLIIAHYLTHTAESMLPSKRQAEAAELQRRDETRFNPVGIRARLSSSTPHTLTNICTRFDLRVTPMWVPEASPSPRDPASSGNHANHASLDPCQMSQLRPTPSSSSCIRRRFSARRSGVQLLLAIQPNDQRFIYSIAYCSLTLGKSQRQTLPGARSRIDDTTASVQVDIFTPLTVG